jgi:hypothetical protein
MVRSTGWPAGCPLPSPRAVPDSPDSITQGLSQPYTYLRRESYNNKPPYWLLGLLLIRLTSTLLRSTIAPSWLQPRNVFYSHHWDLPIPGTFCLEKDTVTMIHSSRHCLLQHSHHTHTVPHCGTLCQSVVVDHLNEDKKPTTNSMPIW